MRSIALSVLVLNITTLVLAGGTKDITVDDRNTSYITYSGNGWDNSYKSTLNLNGFHATSEDKAAYATFTFTGIAVEYLASLWPYEVTTGLQLDNFSKVSVNLTDPNATPTDGGSESSLYGVRWSQTGLTDGEHKLVINMDPDNPTYVVVDGFIYTINTDSDDSTSTTSSSVGPTITGTLATKSQTLPIALGAALGSVAVVAAIILAFICLRRRKRATPHVYPGGYTDAPHIVPFSPPPMTQSLSGYDPRQGKYGSDPRHSVFSPNNVPIMPVPPIQTSLGTDSAYDRSSVVASTVGAAGVGSYTDILHTINNDEYNPYANEYGYNTNTPGFSNLNTYASGSSQAELLAASGSSTTRPLGLDLASGRQGQNGHVLADEMALMRNQKDFQAREDRVEEAPAPPAYSAD